MVESPLALEGLCETVNSHQLHHSAMEVHDGSCYYAGRMQRAHAAQQASSVRGYEIT